MSVHQSPGNVVLIDNDENRKKTYQTNEETEVDSCFFAFYHHSEQF